MKKLQPQLLSAIACRRNGNRMPRPGFRGRDSEGISFPESFDRVLPALHAMVEALIESEQVCINVCNGAHEAEARLVLSGLPMERIMFYIESQRTSHGAVTMDRFF